LIPKIAFFLMRPGKLNFGDWQAEKAHDSLPFRPIGLHVACAATGPKRSQMKFHALYWKGVMTRHTSNGQINTAFRVGQYDAQQRTVDFDMAVVADETCLSKFIHEMAHAGSGCANHLGKHFLTDLCNHRVGRAYFAKIGQQQEQTGEPLVSG
jgi:hypothetical protein